MLIIMNQHGFFFKLAPVTEWCPIQTYKKTRDILQTENDRKWTRYAEQIKENNGKRKKKTKASKWIR